MAEQARRRRFSRPDAATGPYVVGLECGGDHLSVALLRLPEEPGTPPEKWSLLDEMTSSRGPAHADAILTVLAQMLARQELGPADVGLVAAARGPGGFTGVRVGLATAQGLTLGSGAAPWVVDSLLALARNALGTPDATARYVVPLLDARKGQVYGATYRLQDGNLKLAVAPRVDGHEEVLVAAQTAAAGAELVVFGSGALAYDCATKVPARWHRPSALEIATVAAAEWDAADRPAAGRPLDATYIRPSDAELNAR